MAGNFEPGPDGIPYAAWQSLGAAGIDVLWEAAQDLQSEEYAQRLRDAYQDEPSCDFNCGLLCFLPKQPSGRDAAGSPVFLPADTRPLCIVDTANRIVANAARL